jgi:hypothetical protein
MSVRPVDCVRSGFLMDYAASAAAADRPDRTLRALESPGRPPSRQQPSDPMYEIDPERLDLAREFKAKPYGWHSGELQRVLNRMRSPYDPHRYVLVMSERHRQWTLARMGARPNDPLEPVPGYRFESREAAEWTVFKLRWHELTGRALEIP